MYTSGKTTILPHFAAATRQPTYRWPTFVTPKALRRHLFSFRHKREVYHFCARLSNRSPVVFTQGLPFVHRRLTLCSLTLAGAKEKFTTPSSLCQVPNSLFFKWIFDLDTGLLSTSLTQFGGRSNSLSGFAGFVKTQHCWSPTSFGFKRCGRLCFRSSTDVQFIRFALICQIAATHFSNNVCYVLLRLALRSRLPCFRHKREFY